MIEQILDYIDYYLIYLPKLVIYNIYSALREGRFHVHKYEFLYEAGRVNSNYHEPIVEKMIKCKKCGKVKTTLNSLDVENGLKRYD